MKKIFTRYILMLLCIISSTAIISCEKETATKTITIVDTVKIITQQPPPAVDSLSLGLIAYYPFNNSGVDASGNGNHGMLYNISSVADRNGKANAAYHFDGLTSYIMVPDNASLRLANTDLTLSTWVKLDSYNTSFGSNILSKHITGSNNGWAWGVTGSGGTGPVQKGFVTYGPGGNSLQAVSTTVISLNQWHMLTSVYSFSKQQLSMYVDGALSNVSSNILSPNAAITTALYIGRDDPSVPSTGYFVQGALDDLRIYGRALTAAQVQKLYLAYY